MHVQSQLKDRVRAMAETLRIQTDEVYGSIMANLTNAPAATTQFERFTAQLVAKLDAAGRKHATRGRVR